METIRRRRYLILGLGSCLVGRSAPVRAREGSERDAMFARYLEFANLVTGRNHSAAVDGGWNLILHPKRPRNYRTYSMNLYRQYFQQHLLRSP